MVRTLRLQALLAAALLTVGCGSSSESARAAEDDSLRVAAAASVRYAAEALVESFAADHPEIAVEMIYGASGAFVAQIENGAPFDVFLSADTAYPAALAERGLTAGEPFIYGRGTLVLWAANDSPAAGARTAREALNDPGVRHIAIADPEVAPYGRAAQQTLTTLGVDPGDKLVLGENVGQAFQFAQSGAAELAFVAESLAVAEPARAQGKAWALPAESSDPVEHAGVILRDADPEAGVFVNFVLSEAGQAILYRYGFGHPPVGE